MQPIGLQYGVLLKITLSAHRQSLLSISTAAASSSREEVSVSTSTSSPESFVSLMIIGVVPVASRRPSTGHGEPHLASGLWVVNGSRRNYVRFDATQRILWPRENRSQFVCPRTLLIGSGNADRNRRDPPHSSWRNWCGKRWRARRKQKPSPRNAEEACVCSPRGDSGRTGAIKGPHNVTGIARSELILHATIGVWLDQATPVVDGPHLRTKYPCEAGTTGNNDRRIRSASPATSIQTPSRSVAIVPAPPTSIDLISSALTNVRASRLMKRVTA